jgi:hypothetical protein
MGEIIQSGSTYTITWTSSDNVGVISQEILLSTDGGLTYPVTIASGLNGTAQSYNWSVPSSLSTSQARIEIVAQDAQGNQGTASSISDFMVINNIGLPANALEADYLYDAFNQLTNSSSPMGIPSFCNCNPAYGYGFN